MKFVKGMGLVAAALLVSATAAMAMEESKLHFHGYGEVHYGSPKGSDVPKKSDPAQMDFHRMVLGWEYTFTDKIILNAEVDFEHSARDMELEYVYIDFLMNPAFNLRAGAVLMPVGPLNEYHEPTLFYSVERPYVQRTIIPTTWSEGGFGIFGGTESGLRYRFYVVSGLNDKKFTAKDGIRGGRGKGNEAPSDQLAYVGRVEYVGPLNAGISLYQGKGDAANSGGNSEVSIVTGDLRFRKWGWDIQAVYAEVNIDDVANLNTLVPVVPCPTTVPASPCPTTGPLTGNKSIGEKLVGTTFEVAYRIKDKVVPFVRYEEFNTQDEVPAGFTADPKNDRKITTFGVAFYPIPDVAIKVDQEQWENKFPEKGKRTNVGIAYMF
ncbi:MAG: porin [Nitrospirota bacterium]|mgnify:CR=1 FL=1